MSCNRVGTGLGVLSLDNQRISGVIMGSRPVLVLRSSVFLQFQINIDVENTAMTTLIGTSRVLKQTEYAMHYP